jgi:hypothetical protein
MKLERSGNEEQHLCQQQIIGINILLSYAHLFASACQKMKLYVGSFVVGIILVIVCTYSTKNEANIIVGKATLQVTYIRHSW